MPDGVENTPRQLWILDAPPDAAHDKCAGKGKVHDEPDNTTHSQPVDEANRNNPVPGIVLSNLFYECQHHSYSQAGVTQRIDKVHNTPEPFSVRLLYQCVLLSTPAAGSAGYYDTGFLLWNSNMNSFICATLPGR